MKGNPRLRMVRRSLFRILGFALPAALAATFVAGCMAGGGTDVGNPEFLRVTGSLKYTDGSTIQDLPVHLRSREYLHDPAGIASSFSGFALDRNTDSQGFFTFDSVPRGQYRIEATDSAGKGILIDLDAASGNSRIALAPAVLETTGTLAGSINYRGAIGSVYPKIAVAVYGTDRMTYALSDGSFILSNLPAGAYRLRIFTDSLSVEVPETRVEAGGRAEVGPVDLGP
jgi:hypothetical protein